MKAVDLFSGIGGFALACEWAGVETVAFSEIDDYASRVLAKRFPAVRNYGDVRNVPAIDDVWLLCGGPPCQPASSAGRRQGAADNRWLWPQALDVVERVKAEWLLFENPTGILSLNDGLEFENICLALESKGYKVQPIVIPACAVNALHRRDRVWICAHSERRSGSPERKQQQEERSEIANRRGETLTDSECSGRREQLRVEAERQSLPAAIGQESAPRIGSSGEDAADTSGGRVEEQRLSAEGAISLEHVDGRSEANGDAAIKRLPDWSGGALGQPSPLTEFERPSGREIERDFRGMAYGVSRRVDRLRCLGNAIVPQVAYQLIKRMVAA